MQLTLSGHRLELSAAGLTTVEDSFAIVGAGDLTVTLDEPSANHYRHGWGSWDPTAWRPLSESPWRIWNRPNRLLTAGDTATDDPTKHRGSLVGALELASDQVLLVGALGIDAAVVDATPNSLRGSSETGSVPWLIAVGPEESVWQHYTGALRDALGIPWRSEITTPARHVGPIWSSWYSWFEEITADIIRDEIGPAAALGYDVLQIDDGWMQTVGDWQAGPNFPDGMASIAAEIREAQMRAGLWLAPFIALPTSRVVLDHPEMFLQDDSGFLNAGHNWGEHYFALDLSRADAQEWVRHTVGTCHGWGFDVLKLDFLYAGALKARRHRNIGREEAYRLGLRAARAAVGDNAYLLGSGTPVAASLGLVDGMRVGPDTAPYWDNTERLADPSGPAVVNALRNSVSRLWLSPLVECDPDVAIFRSRGSLLSPEAAQVSADLAHVCGVAGCSDPSAWLTDDERERVRSWIATARRGAEIRVTGRYRFDVDGRDVDFEPWLFPPSRLSDRILAK